MSAARCSRRALTDGEPANVCTTVAASLVVTSHTHTHTIPIRAAQDTRVYHHLMSHGLAGRFDRRPCCRGSLGSWSLDRGPGDQRGVIVVSSRLTSYVLSCECTLILKRPRTHGANNATQEGGPTAGRPRSQQHQQQQQTQPVHRPAAVDGIWRRSRRHRLRHAVGPKLGDRGRGRGAGRRRGRCPRGPRVGRPATAAAEG